MCKSLHKTSNKFDFFKQLFPGVILLLSFTGCGGYSDKRGLAEGDTLLDALGREVRLVRKPGRVMALAPSMTEMLFFVCDTGQIAAVTQNCDYPAAARRKPIVNNYPMDFEALLRVRPDLVFAVEGITPLADARRMEELGIPVYYQQYHTVEDIFTGIETVGRLTGNAARAVHLTDSLRRVKKEIQTQTAGLQKPSVLAITWQDPIYVYGRNTVFTDKLAIAGGRNAVDTVFEAQYPALTREYVLKINPDIIIGGGFGKMDSTFFRQYPELRRINAYRNRRIYDLTDDLMARPGPRVVESILELKEVIHGKK